MAILLSNRQRRKSFMRMDLRIILYCVLIIFIVFLALFKLPLFFPDKISTITGIISNISVEESPALKATRKVLYFDVDHSSYYYPLTNVVGREEINPLIMSLQEYESSQTPITIEITTEIDYRDLFLSGGRRHAISLSYGSKSMFYHYPIHH